VKKNIDIYKMPPKEQAKDIDTEIKKLLKQNEKRDRNFIQKIMDTNSATRISFRQDNPKSKNSKARERYEMYKSARTIRGAKQKGAKTIDILNDYEKGFLKIVPQAKTIEQEIANLMKQVDKNGGGGSSGGGGNKGGKKPGGSGTQCRTRMKNDGTPYKKCYKK